MRIKNTVLISSFTLLFASTCFAGGGGWDFNDVPEGHAFYNSINYFRDMEVMYGDDIRTETGETESFAQTFRPDDILNRAELAAIIFRLESGGGGSAIVVSSTYKNCFPDVTDEWYASHVCWAKEQGYVKGFEAGDLEGKYGPDQPVRLGELLVILSRFSNWETTEDSSKWYESSLQYGDQHNIVRDISFDMPVSRGLVAETLYRDLMFKSFKWPYMDFATLEYFQDENLSDQNHLYISGQPVPDIDPQTAEIIYLPFLKDATGIYHATDGFVEDADPETFEHLSGIFFKDKNYLFDANSGAYPKATKDYGISPDNIQIVSDSPEVTYLKNDTSVLMTDPEEGYLEISGADVDSFERISYHYSKDKNNIFFENQLLDEIDTDTFEIIEEQYMPAKTSDLGYTKDANAVYYNREKMESADSYTFLYLNIASYAKDAENYFYEGEPIENIEYDTYEIINYNNSKDANHVYFDREVIPGADPATFEHIYSFYTKDKNAVFYKLEQMEDADPATFETFLNGYSKDEDTVYYMGNILEGADASSFEFLLSGYAKDKNYVYNNGIRTEEDPNGFLVSH